MDTVKRINEGKKSVLRLPFHEVPGAFIIVSFQYPTTSKAHAYFYTRFDKEMVADTPLMTFFYGGPEMGAEWEPRYGPIMTYRRCAPDWRGSTFAGSELKAREHWFYDHVEDNALAWSQLAVEREGMKEMLGAGDFKGIFDVLRRWSDREAN
jgi:hypothetical protein